MKQALVISGGGSKGAFSVGVVKDLVNTYRIDFEILVGTSTGALIIPLVALGEIAKLEELYTSVSTDKIIKKYNFGERVINGDVSIFTFGPLKEIIKNIYTDDFFTRLLNSGKEIFLTTVCLQTEELVVFTTAQNHQPGKYYKVKKLENGEQFRAAVLASASQPVFTPPVKVNASLPSDPHQDLQYVDGGVREYAGIAIAADAGAQEIFTILHAAKNFVPDLSVQYKSIFPVLQQTLAMFITDVGDNDVYLPYQYNEGLKYIKAVKKKMEANGVSKSAIDSYFTLPDTKNVFQNREPFKIHIIQPDQPLGGGPGGLDFNPIEMREMVVSGKMALQAYVANLPPGDVGWA
ncbi:MAG: patatin-like phospholipase family protein [Niabella sp.]